jgi:hypothetical protein
VTGNAIIFTSSKCQQQSNRSEITCLRMHFRYLYNPCKTQRGPGYGLNGLSGLKGRRPLPAQSFPNSILLPYRSRGVEA